MQFDIEKNKILISVKEFVSIARRGISPTLPRDEDEPELCYGEHGRELEYELSAGGFDFLMRGRVEKCGERNQIGA